MLLEFTCKNYKTFKIGATLSLVPTDDQDLTYSIIKQKADDTDYSGLSSAVIYGANAAGKSNLISAMETFRHFVLFGLSNLDYKSSSTSPLLFSNFKSKESKPVELSITFITENMLVTYFIAFRANKSDPDSVHDTCSITSEQLTINSELVFDRNTDKKKLCINYKNKMLINLIPDIDKLAKESNDILKNNLASTDLFLTSGFKNYICLELVESILNWFRKQFIPICNSQKQRLFLSGKYEDDAFVELPVPILNAVKMIGGDNKIGYKKAFPDALPIKASIITKDKRPYFIPSDLVESLGTLRFLDIFPRVINALQQGATLIVDELDASIHPQVIVSIIGAFHNDEINKRGAQLVFNTQNPVYLNKAFFRKDEIYFVEKNRRTLNSELYSLADFQEGKHNNYDYMNNYLKEMYGALPYIDFSNIIYQSLQEKN